IERTHDELAALGLHEQHVTINAVMPNPGDTDDLARSIYLREQALLGDLPANLRGLSIDVIPLKSRNMVGLDALEGLLDDPAAGEGPLDDGRPAFTAADDEQLGTEDLATLVDDLIEQDHGLVMVMGKGGVGKTTIASAIAVALAERGLPVHLTTTDPAAHLTSTLDGALPNLDVSRIDPEIETLRYRERVLRSKGSALDEA